MTNNYQNRILIVDDNKDIHQDFYKVLMKKNNAIEIEEDESVLFNKIVRNNKDGGESYLIDSAYQGQEALELVKTAISTGKPYALAFVDIRMPPGWDGVETIKRIWEVDANIQIVICSAHSDHSWEDIAQQLGVADNLLILKKPFEPIEIRQLASALTRKWQLIANLHTLVKERTADLEESFSLIKATLESTQEGIIVAKKNTKIITYNEMFLRIWDISADFLNSENSEVIFQKLAEQVEEADLFSTMMVKLCNEPIIGRIKEWKTNTGKVIELYTHPQYLHDKTVACVFSFRDVTERKQLEQQLLRQATHDSLTGLSNRILLVDRIQQAITQAKRTGLFVGVLFFDLDNFKQVNDSLGHDAGDTLLKIIAKKLTQNVRECDTVTRMGGDEFIIVLPSQSSIEELSLKASQLLEIFASPHKIQDHEFIVTTSIGISIYPKDGLEPDALLKNADAALYQVKGNGRNNFQFYIPEFNAHMLKKTELITELRHAQAKNEFILNYQPLIKLSTGKTIGVEALIRWHHPSLGLMLPDIFIPLAEEVGSIVEIGEWVLKTACSQNKNWQQLFGSEIIVAVNVSVYQFRQKNFVKIVQKILEETGLEPQYLELEITESIILGNVTEVLQKMQELKKLGIRLAMDDFGTGYASLSYLKYFPFDKLKIDKSFIDGINLNNEDNAIIEAIINMAKTLKMEVLAEGVENAEQVEFLRAHQADQLQGYYLSPPLDVDACAHVLKKQKSMT